MKSKLGILSATRWPCWAKLTSAVLVALLVAFSGAIGAKPGKKDELPTVVLDGLYPQIGDVLYLSDSCPCGNLTRIFRVLINEADSTAGLVLLGQTEDFLQIDCLATSPDGKRLYLVEKLGGSGGAQPGADPSKGDGAIGYLDLETGTFHNADGSDPVTGTPTYLTVPPGELVNRIPEVVLGAFSPDGMLYVASQTTDELYRLDVIGNPTSGVAESLGKILVQGTPVNLHGADIAFSADGRLFVWSNFPNAAAPTVAPRGLYEITLADSGNPTAQYIGLGGGGCTSDPNCPRFTGLAFRYNGLFEGASMACTDRPTELTFVYEPRACANSDNDQPSDKFTCSGDVGGGVTALVTKAKDPEKVYFSGAVAEDGEILIEASAVGRKDVDSDLRFVLTDDSANVQEITLHSSCSKPLAVGDTFGSVGLVSFTNKDQGTVPAGTEAEEPYGELAGSTCCNHIMVLGLGGETPAEVINEFESYGMCDCSGNGYDYTFGDMSGGPYGYFPCVFTIGYWKNHPWQYVDGVDANVVLCAGTAYEAVIGEMEGQALLKASGKDFSMLTAQLIAAKLNTGGGAGLAMIRDAEAFLCEATEGDWDMPFESKEQKEMANDYKDALDHFNNGKTEFGAKCEVEKVLSLSCKDIKDLTTLSMVWNGGDGVTVTTALGQVFSDIGNGNKITFLVDKKETGNDFQITLSGAVTGTSEFHLSCSDPEMNGAEDCGKNQGDGKKDEAGLINDWLLDGMAGEKGSIECDLPNTGEVMPD